EASEDDDGVLDKPSLKLRSLVNPVSIRFMKLCFGSKRVSCACFLQVLVLYVQYGISKVRIRRIEESGVTTNPSKIEAIKNWPVPSTLKQFRGFLGLSRYYSGFIKSYAMLKKAMMEAPILRLPDFDQEFVIKTYAYGIGAVLCQNGHPLAYLSKTLSTKHQALSTYEKDFIAVVGKSGKGWLPKLLGYDYEIVFKKGVDNAAVDAFSRVYQGAELLQIVVSSMASDVMEKIKASWQSDDTMQQLVSKGSQLQGLSKYAYFMPLSHPFNASQVAQVFLDRVYKLHRLHESIVSDRDKVFLITFWKSLFSLLKVKLKLSTTYHPQTDGQTEVLNFGTTLIFTSVINTTPYEVVYCQIPPLHIPYIPGDSRVENVDRTLQNREELKICHGKGQQMGSLPQLKEDGLLDYKPMEILERRLEKVNNKPVMYVLIQWTNRTVKKATWEIYADVLARFLDFNTA
ncbi:reverse transcriptase, partial [Tanacetum coccineum]